MPSSSSWQPAHVWLVRHRVQINNFFSAIHWTTIICIVGAYFVLQLDDSWWLVLDSIARKAGTTSALLYLLTHVPGILKRFNFLPLFKASLFLFRRQFGVTMFLLSIFHQSVMGLFPKLIQFGFVDPKLLTQHEIYGSAGLLLLFPLWLTSNDTSVKKLGPWWKRVHRLTYIALFFIYLHVATVSNSLRLLFIMVAMTQLASWVYYWIDTFKKRNVKSEVQ
jgi:DMSO/TMAO reductase YedYZ heme-binding membrane subunit